MRDVLNLPVQAGGSLIFASDNSGGIGMKKADVVTASYDVVAYYSFRVAVMECMAAGADPIAVVMENFCGEQAWSELEAGVRQGQAELGLSIPITGSTETNMEMVQSALGILVIGQKKEEEEKVASGEMGVIGTPLMGEGVINHPELIAPLSLFKWCCEQENMTILPVGSKGIANEWLHLDPSGTIPQAVESLDLNASAGPSTCFIIVFDPEKEAEIAAKAGHWFHR